MCRFAMTKNHKAAASESYANTIAKVGAGCNAATATLRELIVVSATSTITTTTTSDAKITESAGCPAWCLSELVALLDQVMGLRTHMAEASEATGDDIYAEERLYAFMNASHAEGFAPEKTRELAAIMLVRASVRQRGSAMEWSLAWAWVGPERYSLFRPKCRSRRCARATDRSLSTDPTALVPRVVIPRLLQRLRAEQSRFSARLVQTPKQRSTQMQVHMFFLSE